MIYQLISFNRYFGVAITILVSAMFSASRAHSPNAFLLSFWPAGAAFAIAYMEGDRRALPFHLGLPIPVRSIFLSRTLPLLCMLWLPVLIDAAVWGVWMGARDPASMFILSVPASVLTVGVLLLSVTRAEELTASLEMRVVFIFLVIFAAFVSVFPWYGLVPVCAVCTVLLFRQIWRILPQSFQIAPRWAESNWDAESHAPAASAGGNTDVFACRRGSPLKPFLRSVLGHYSFLRAIALLFSLLAVFATGYGSKWIFLFYVMLLHGGWFRDNTRWMRFLPVRTQTMLLVFLSPFLLMMIAGYALHSMVARTAVRMQIVDVGAMSGLAFITLIIAVIGNWRRKGAWRYASGVVFLLMLGWLWPDPSSYGQFLSGASPKLSEFLPNDAWGAGLIVAMALLLLYLALSKVFSEAEYPGAPQQLP